MKLITRNTDYAVRAICCIAKNKNMVFSVSHLVKESKVPRPFLRKILQILSKRGIVDSYKGKGGGFKLAELSEHIFLKDLIEIFQGPLRLNECYFKKKKCPNVGACSLKKKIDTIERDLINDLSSITISSLL